MKKKRKVQILEIINKQSEVRNMDLADHFGVSYASIRRDLIQLEEEGLIKRTSGGAICISASENIAKPIDYKAITASESKDYVARYAASLIENGMHVFCDSGSAVLQMAKYIYKKDICITTNNISLALETSKKGIKTFLLPGRLNMNHSSVSSMEALRMLNQMHFNICFLGVSGISKNNGYRVNAELICAMKKTALSNSDITYILGDSTKYGVNCINKMADFDDAYLITDVNNGYLIDNGKIIEVNRIPWVMRMKKG